MLFRRKNRLLFKRPHVLLAAACLASGLGLATTRTFGRTREVPWHEPVADVRYEVTAYLDVWDEAPPAQVVHVSVCPPAHPAGGLVPAVYRRDGARCPARVLNAAPGEPMTVAFDVPQLSGQVKADTEHAHVYLLYLHPALAHPPVPRLQGGIRLESRTSEGPVTEYSVETFENRWDSAHRTNGTLFVDAIHHPAPVLPPTADVPSEYAAYEPSVLLLNRYTAFIEVARDTNAIREAREVVASAEEQRERVLEKATAAKHKLREAEYELGMSAKYPDVIKTSQEVLRERLYSRLRVYDGLVKRDLIDVNERIRTATNAIAEIESGRHTFFTGSRAGSHLLINGHELIHWPAERSLNRYHGRYVNLAEATTNLPPGRHQVAFQQYGTFDHCMTAVAWRPPGNEHARTFSASDALPAVEGRITAIDSATEQAPPLVFQWRVVDDLRCPSVGDMAQMEFVVLNPHDGSRYEWRFGDGRRSAGTAVSHLYFRTAMYPVVLTERSPQGDAQRVARQHVRAHVLWTKRELADLEDYENDVMQTELSGAEIAGLLNAYAFARHAATESVPLDGWRQHVHATLLNRLQDVPPDEVGRILDVANDAATPALQRYNEALRAYRMVLDEFMDAPAPVRREAVLGLADLHLNVLGNPATAQEQLDALSLPAKLDPGLRLRYDRLRVHARLANGAVQEARQLARSLARPAKASGAKQEVARQAELRRARALLSKPEQADKDIAQAVEILDRILLGRPEDILAPDVNHLYMRAHLQREEFQRALHLADRLLRLDMSAAYELPVRKGRINALYGLGRENEAQDALKALRAEHPYRSDILDGLPIDR